MSKDHPTDKPAHTNETTDAPAAEVAPVKPVRKIVRRSGATRDNAAFAEASVSPSEEPSAASASPSDGDKPSEGASGAPAAESQAHPAPTAEASGPASSGEGASSVRARATFDARAPRPRPPAGGGSSPGPRRPARTSQFSGDYRPPPGRPVGARPIPGGSRAPSGEESPRGDRSDGDFRPPPARPVGARPIPGGPRAPSPSHERRGPRPGGPRPDRPGFDRGERPARPAVPSSAGHAPQPHEAPKPAPKPPVAAPKAAPKAVPVFIPLARAGQIAPPSAKPALTPKEALAARTKAHASAAKPAAAPKASAAPAPSFDADVIAVGGDGAVAALAKAGEAAVALVDAWASASNAAALVEAAENEEVASPPRKAARRALSVLRSRGVTIPVRERVVKQEPRVVVEEAMFTVPDALGTYVLSITQRDPSGRFRLVEILIREPYGVLQAWGGWVSGSQIKESRAKQAAGYGMASVEVPVAWARHRIANARVLNTTSGQVVPLGIERCLTLLEPVPAEAPHHPLAGLEGEITTEQSAAAAVASGALHAEPEFRGWLADRSAVDEMLVKLGERIGPQGKDMGKDAFDSAMAEEIASATDRYFSPERRAQLASRMRDAAISVRARKGDQAATEVLRVARAVTDAGLITSPPREIPFLRQFFEIGLRAIAQQSGGELRVPVSAQPSTTG